MLEPADNAYKRIKGKHPNNPNFLSKERMSFFMAECKAAYDALGDYRKSPNTLRRVRYVSIPFPISSVRLSVDQKTLKNDGWATSIALKIKNAREGDDWDRVSNCFPAAEHEKERQNTAFVALMICYYIRHAYLFEEVASEKKSMDLTALWIDGDSLEPMYFDTFNTISFNRDCFLNRCPVQRRSPCI